MNQKYYYWNKQTKIIEKTKSHASDQQQRKNSLKRKRGSRARRVCKQNHTQKITISHLRETKICAWTKCQNHKICPLFLLAVGKKQTQNHTKKQKKQPTMYVQNYQKYWATKTQQKTQAPRITGQWRGRK